MPIRVPALAGDLERHVETVPESLPNRAGVRTMGQFPSARIAMIGRLRGLDGEAT
jgi:hypothetical protein